MRKEKIHQILTFLISIVWFINGFFCKILNLVPRHEEIVAQIFGDHLSRLLIIIIGTLEVLMAIWILSKIQSKLNAIIQIIVVASMNVMEFILVPDLLLWGKFNSVVALLFIIVIYYNEFILNKRQTN